MQIAAIQAMSPAVPVRSTMPALVDVPPPTPAAGLYRSRGMDILQLSGVYSLSWRMATPDTLELNVYTEQDAALLSMLLEPVVDGVKLELRYGADRKTFTGTPSGSVNDMLRGIAGLPGVWNVDKRGITTEGGRARVLTINQATIDRLNPLIKDRLDFGRSPQGRQRWVNLAWIPGIPG